MTTAPPSTGTPGPIGGDTAPDDDTTSQGLTDFGGGPVFYDNLVEVSAAG